MTDRHSSYIVILDHDIREDDAEATLTALRMVKGVISVEPNIASVEEAIARERVGTEWTDALLDFIKERRGW